MILHIYLDCKKQNSELMLEVREFELAALKTVPAQVHKKNLQPVSYYDHKLGSFRTYVSFSL